MVIKYLCGTLNRNGRQGFTMEAKRKFSSLFRLFHSDPLIYYHFSNNKINVAT